MRLIHSTLRLGIAQLSVYAFSTENWNRSPDEIAHLFNEMVAAARALAAEAVAGTIQPEDISPEDIARHLCASDLPDVDLLIRTSGEQRTSNFLPWHLAYAEFVFEPTHWPDFGYQHLLAAITEYAGRQRRFGSDMNGEHDTVTLGTAAADSTHATSA
jgi:undecaprenyl pyrophosphate synthase